MKSVNVTIERNTQIVIALMKAHGVKKVVTSPGTMNVCLISSIQDDPFFEVFSAPEERSAAYIACGIAAETGEVVALTCTGATASRNYMPGLTEAYYRKLPILTITCSKKSMYIGHNIEQVTDRTLLPRDVVKISVQANYIVDSDTEWQCTIACNKAFLELNHNGMGPVHINLETMTTKGFTSNPKPVRIIKRITEKNGNFPDLKYKNVAVMIGSHHRWDEVLTKAVDEFCEKYNAAVLCDQTGNYKGKYSIYHSLIMVQHNYIPKLSNVDLVVYIGNVSAGNFNVNSKELWRVNEDGEIRDVNKRLTAVFEMDEIEFFNHYNKIQKNVVEMSYYSACLKEENEVLSRIPNMPFSSFYIAHKYANSFPENSSVHYAIRNSQRVFSYFRPPQSVYCCSNTGGFGIDGCVSTAIGASLSLSDGLCFCIVGDLAFFYDLNSLGNRHIGKNLRIILVNNGTGMEMNFRDSFPGIIGVQRDKYIAASGHYGNQSRELVKHYTEDLGFKYMSAASKDEFDDCMKILLNNDMNTSIVCEVFVNKKDEDDAYAIITRLVSSQGDEMKNKIKDSVSKIIGDRGKRVIKALTSD